MLKLRKYYLHLLTRFPLPNKLAAQFQQKYQAHSKYCIDQTKYIYLSLTALFIPRTESSNTELFQNRPPRNPAQQAWEYSFPMYPLAPVSVVLEPQISDTWNLHITDQLIYIVLGSVVE
jgi:hypothetical protein